MFAAKKQKKTNKSKLLLQQKWCETYPDISTHFSSLVLEVILFIFEMVKPLHTIPLYSFS